MNIFISHSSADAHVALELARALTQHGVTPLMQTAEAPAGSDWKESIEDAGARADAFVIVVDAAHDADRKQELEWRSALRAQWDSAGTRPMIPLLIGDASPPPFLRDKTPVRMQSAAGDYDAIADQLMHAIRNPSQAGESASKARASEERKKSYQVLERFADALESSEESETVERPNLGPR